MKYEWKKRDKALYLPKSEPAVITVPAFSFFMLNGMGDPNGGAFTEAVSVLYPLSYGVKMSPKQGRAPEGYYEYSIFPLEGVWSLTEEGKALSRLDKNELVYTVMIRQPDFVDEAFANETVQTVKKKKPHPLLDAVTFGNMEEGLCVQMLHEGPYDTEPESFAMMDGFCAENGYTRIGDSHREIYLTDARKTAPEKQRTVLRIQVRKDR